jgi:hypothetical protein
LRHPVEQANNYSDEQTLDQLACIVVEVCVHASCVCHSGFEMMPSSKTSLFWTP